MNIDRAFVVAIAIPLEAGRGSRLRSRFHQPRRLKHSLPEWRRSDRVLGDFPVVGILAFARHQPCSRANAPPDLLADC